MVSRIRIPKKSVTAYLTGSLGFAGSGRWREAEALEMGLSCYRSAVGLGFAHLPFFLVFDLRMIAEHGVSFSFAQQQVEGVDAMLRSRYENQILNRLLREHCVQQALEILAFHKVHVRDRTRDAQATDGFAHRADRLTLLLLERLASYWPETYQINAAHLRDLILEVPSDDAVAAAASELPDEGQSWGAVVERFVHAATGAEAGMRSVVWSSIIRAEDLFELEHLDVLDRAYLRRQVRNLIDVRESLPPASPHDLPIREETSEVESRFLDQSQYPTGGFSELTNRGSFENLVLSELIYMGEGVDLGDEPSKHDRAAGLRAFGIDLFDVRFVEGELLFYSRDSGHLLRKRRTLHLCLDMREPLSIKYPDHPYQLGTMVVGVVLALVRDMILLFFNDALHFTIHLVHQPETAGGEPPEEVSKLKEVLDILLEAPIQHGILEILPRDGTDGVDLGVFASWQRKGYFVGFSTSPTVIEDWAFELRERRRGSPPLFGAAISLAEGETIRGEEEEGGPVIHLELATSTLAQLKHEILLRVTTQ